MAHLLTLFILSFIYIYILFLLFFIFWWPHLWVIFFRSLRFCFLSPSTQKFMLILCIKKESSVSNWCCMVVTGRRELSVKQFSLQSGLEWGEPGKEMLLFCYEFPTVSPEVTLTNVSRIWGLTGLGQSGQGLHQLLLKWPQWPAHCCPASPPACFSYPLLWNKPLQNQFIKSHNSVVFLSQGVFLYSRDIAGQSVQAAHSTRLVLAVGAGSWLGS